MKIRSYSDIHWEFENTDGKNSLFWNPPVMKDEKNTILVHPGDLFFGDHSAHLINLYARRFKKVIVVLGNHDYWDFILGDENGVYSAATRLRNKINEFGLGGHVIVLDRSTYSIDNHLFVGATLWTNLNSGDPAVIGSAKKTMNDFDRINISVKNGVRKFNTDDWQMHHELDFGYIRQVVEKNKGMKIVVVTHHAPTERSIPASQDGKLINHFYYSECSDWIRKNPHIKLWLHGHVHQFNDYKVGNTRVICNPRGYVKTKTGPQNTGFKKDLELNILIKE